MERTNLAIVSGGTDGKGEPVDALFTIKEASKYLTERHGAKFSVSWLYREAGLTVPCVRPKPRMLRFRRSDLDRWITQLKG